MYNVIYCFILYIDLHTCHAFNILFFFSNFISSFDSMEKSHLAILFLYTYYIEYIQRINISSFTINNIYFKIVCYFEIIVCCICISSMSKCKCVCVYFYYFNLSNINAQTDHKIEM